ncbi:carbon-nitrogen hydrolase [bacterium]|nr:MAG: carbon-nitrogen hydrolase [bacterium]
MKKKFLMDQFRVALAQLEPRLFDKETNLAKAEEYIRRAASGGAAVILFPELYLTGYGLDKRAVEMAENIEGPSVRRVAELAFRHQIAVIMGYAELSPDCGHAYDAMFVVNAQGHLSGSYRKMHLFHAESNWFLPGEEFSVIDFGLGPVGLLICYDLEFPESSRTLALSGAKWIATCTGNMVPNQHLQEVYVQSRAAENRLWVALANRVGHEGNLTFFGRSAIADPYGELIVQAGDGDTILFADIDLTRADQARLNADYLADRTPHLYRMLDS